MNKLSLLFRTVCVAAVSAAFFATTAPAANPRSVALTIQENGTVRISETHDLPPTADSTVEVAPVPETILPASVSATSSERSQPLEIVTQRFAYDLGDEATLFRAYRGLPVVCRAGTNAFIGSLASLPDVSAPAPSLVLANANQSLRFIPNLLLLDAVEFPARTDVARVPTLYWQLPPRQTPPASVQLNYSASGLFWEASHDAVLATDTRSISLATRVHIRNETTRAFDQATVCLALTERAQFPPLIPSSTDPRAGAPVALRYSDDGTSWVPERSAAASAVVANYDLPHPLSIPAHSDVYASLASFPSLATETVLVYDGVRFDRYQRNRRTDALLGTDFSPVVETRLTFTNEGKTPLPPGPFRVLRGNPNAPLEWVGTDWLPPLAPLESATLRLGPAAGLSGQRIRTAFSEVVPLKVTEESFEITLHNQTPFARTIRVVEHLYRGETHEITAAGAEYMPGDAPNRIFFDLPVKAGSSRTFTYTVRYSW
jgi:hypothetical protein